MRLRLLASSLVAVIAAALLSAPAEAAPRPSRVGLVSITASNTYTSGGKTYARLQLTWPKAARATKYQVFVGRSAGKVARKKTPTLTVRGTTASVRKLRRNTEYWFQVRAVNSRKAGLRSARVARITMLASPALSSPAYTVMSYNVCTNVCSKWSTRQPIAINEVLRLNPDVVAFQEASKWGTATIPGYTQTLGGTDNRIFYRTDRFDQVTQYLEDDRRLAVCPTPKPTPTPTPTPTTPTTTATTTPSQSVTTSTTSTPSTTPTTTPTTVPTTKPTAEPCTQPVDGLAEIPGKNVPWSLLRDKASGQMVQFAAMHLQVDDGKSYAAYRATQMGGTFAALRSQMAWWGLDFEATPVVLVGDYNTNRSRYGNAYLDNMMHANGFYDAYEQARKLSRQHYNTANPSWSTYPRIGVTWGDHVDKVWVRPGRTRVLLWANAGLMAGGRWVAPLASDHHPLLVQVRVS